MTGGELIDLAAGRKGAEFRQESTRSTSELLDSIGGLIGRYVVLPSPEAKVALELFVLHTWAIEAAHSTPYLAIVSPEKQSGKTRVLEVLELVVRAPWRTASTTEAALFRKIEQDEPCLLLDEIDAIFGSNSERTEPLRAVLNAGNRRGSSATRVVGQGTKMEVKDFSVFCPKVLAGIDTGRLPETIQDRAVTLHMERRRPGEPIDRLRYRVVAAETKPLRDELEAWAVGALEHLQGAVPELPCELSDRMGDAWEPLLAVADFAGGGWGERARLAAIKLSASKDDEELGRGAQILGAMRTAMDGIETIFTSTLLQAINDDEELPFGGWSEGKGLDSRGLAKLLKPYRIRSKQVRVGDESKKGYHRDALRDAWERYLPAPEGSQASHGSQTDEPTDDNAHEQGDVTPVTPVTPVAGVRDTNGKLTVSEAAYAENFRARAKREPTMDGSGDPVHGGSST